MTSAPLPPPLDEKSLREQPLYRLAVYGLLAGSTSFIPLPWVDDWTLEWVRRRLIQESCHPQIRLTDSGSRVLLDRGLEKPARGCLATVLLTPFSVLWYLAGRLFRKFFFFLAIKESTDRASLAFHEGYLLSAAARLPSLHAHVRDGNPEALRQLAYTLVETLEQTDTSPIRKLIVEVSRGSYRILFAAARRLRRLLRRRPETALEEEERVLREPAQRLTHLLETHRRYFTQLETRLQTFAQQRNLIQGPNHE